MQEEWASKSSRVEREKAFRDARIAARNARLYPHGVPAGTEPLNRQAELMRRATIGGVSILGAMVLYRLAGPLDRALEWPSWLVYAFTGAVAGGVFGALAKSENRSVRVVKTCAAAILAAGIFVLLSRGLQPFWWLNK